MNAVTRCTGKKCDDDDSNIVGKFMYALVSNAMSAAALAFFIKDKNMIEAIVISLVIGIFFVFNSFSNTYILSGKALTLLLIDSMFHICKLVLFSVIIVGLR